MRNRTNITSRLLQNLPVNGIKKRTLTYGIGLLPLAFTLSGCAPTYHSIINEPLPVLQKEFSISGQEKLTSPWWLQFNDPPLHDQITAGLEGNFDLKSAFERLKQAEAIARKTGAELSPTLDWTASGTQSRTRSDSGTTNSTTYSLGLSAGYEIDLWGRIEARADAALLDVDGSREDLRTAALSISSQIGSTWYQLGNAISQLELLQKQQEINRQGLGLIRLRFNAGQVSIADLLQQEQLIESSSGDMALQRASIKTLENQLAILSGISPGTINLPNRPQLLSLPPLPYTGPVMELLQQRPDIKSSFLSLAAADKRLAAAVADRYPRLSLSANLTSSGDWSDLFDNWLASIAANLIGPIVDGGSKKAEVDRLSAAAREQFNKYSQTILSAIGEVENSLIQETEQQKLIESLEIQLKLAHQTVETTLTRYKHGAENYQRVLSANLSLQNLERSLLSAKLQQILYRISLYRALGGFIDHTFTTEQP